LERDAENSYLASDAVTGGPMDQLLGHSITYRIAVGPQAGRKVFTLQTLPACEPDDYADTAGNVSGFSLHAGVSARADARKKLEFSSRASERLLLAKIASHFHASGVRSGHEADPGQLNLSVCFLQRKR
jgi:hypothetical protein